MGDIGLFTGGRVSSDVWVGAAVSIPISIGVGLALPSIQRWLDKRGETSHAKKLDRVKSEYERILYYALHTDLMLGHLVVLLIYLVTGALAYLAWQAAAPLIGGLSADLLKSWHPWFPGTRRSLEVVGLSTILTLTFTYVVWLFRLANRYLTIFLNVKHFKSYVNSVPAEIRDTKMEEVISCATLDRAVPGYGALESKFAIARNVPNGTSGDSARLPHPEDPLPANGASAPLTQEPSQ